MSGLVLPGISKQLTTAPVFVLGATIQKKNHTINILREENLGLTKIMFCEQFTDYIKFPFTTFTLRFRTELFDN